MKFLIAAFVFFLTLGLTVKTIAEEAGATCTGETAAHCGSTGAAHAKAGHSHGDLSAKMNSLFPEKQKNGSKAMRPSIIEIKSPKFLSEVAGTTANLEWKEAQGANSYHVQVATDPNFKWIVAEDHFVKTTTFAFTKAEAGHKYFWRVAAFNTENESTFTKSNFVSSVFTSK